MTGCEWITYETSVLGLVVSAGARPDETTFLTAPAQTQQLGFIVYRAGEAVTAHEHRRVPRQIEQTTEVVLVRHGRCRVDFYRPDHSLHCSRELEAGDLVLLVEGGHGFHMHTDTTLLEIKQGPYTGAEDKVRFRTSDAADAVPGTEPPRPAGTPNRADP